MIWQEFEIGERVAMNTGKFDEGLPVLSFARVLGTNPLDGNNSWVLEREDDVSQVLVYRWDNGSYRADLGNRTYWTVYHLDNKIVRRVQIRSLSAEVVAQAEAILAATPSASAQTLASQIRTLQELVGSL